MAKELVPGTIHPADRYPADFFMSPCAGSSGGTMCHIGGIVATAANHRKPERTLRLGEASEGVAFEKAI